MKVIVTYNVPSSAVPEDYACHEGVLDQVRDVTKALKHWDIRTKYWAWAMTSDVNSPIWLTVMPT